MEENNDNALTKVFYILLISDFTVNELTITYHKSVLDIYCINKKTNGSHKRIKTTALSRKFESQRFMSFNEIQAC